MIDHIKSTITALRGPTARQLIHHMADMGHDPVAVQECMEREIAEGRLNLRGVKVLVR